MKFLKTSIPGLIICEPKKILIKEGSLLNLLEKICLKSFTEIK